MRIPLKVAIVMTGKTQRTLALECGIPEGRLSAIVRGAEEATQIERGALQVALGRPEALLFVTQRWSYARR